MEKISKTMKKIFNFTPLIVSLAVITTVFCGCSFISDIFSRHEHTTTHTLSKPSTCTENGNVEYWHCTDCGKYFLDENCELEISTKTIVVPLADHSFSDWTIEKEPTETENGLKSSVCSVCNYKTTVAIEKLQHTHKYSTEWQSDIGGHWNLPVCGCEDAPVGNYSEHIVKNGGKCSVCNYDVAENDLLSLSGGDYGYSLLNDKESQFYDLLKDRISSFHKSGNAIVTPVGGTDNYTTEGINFSSSGLTKEEALNVFDVFKADNPLYYWISTKTLYNSSVIYPVVVDEYAFEAQRLQVNGQLETAVKDFYKRADFSDSDYRKALGFHDAIIDFTDYAYDENGLPSEKNSAHSILGVFLNGTKGIDGAVCEGYAKAFQLLLNLSNIDNLTVRGLGLSNSSYENHAWNMGKIQGEYYNFDLTWDDQPSNAYGKIYSYFCKPSSDEKFTGTHLANKILTSEGITDDVLYDLPQKTAQNDYDGNDRVYGKILQGANDYVIIGYDKLQLISCDEIGSVNLPDVVKYSGNDYSLVGIGTVYGDSNTLSSVFKTGVTSLTIPSNVSFIWDLSLRCSTLNTITVAETNESFSSSDGVLYTKNKYTLVLYPPKKLGLTYTVSDSCKIIAYNAFYATNLASLSVSENLTGYYLPNYGLGYVDDDKEYASKIDAIMRICNSINASETTVNLTQTQFKNKTGINKINVY